MCDSGGGDGSSSSSSDTRRKDRRLTDRQLSDGQTSWLHGGAHGTGHHPLSGGGGGGAAAAARKWRVGGWVGGLRVKLKEVGMDGRGTLKMFARKKRELIKTPSITKKSRAGSPAPQSSAPSVSSASLLFFFCVCVRVRACQITVRRRADRDSVTVILSRSAGVGFFFVFFKSEIRNFTRGWGRNSASASFQPLQLTRRARPEL